MIERLTIFGVGLIGGSLALALKRAGAVAEVVGTGRCAERLEGARQAGLIDRAETEPARAVAGADLVLLGVPLGAIASALEALRPHLPPETVVTDAGSAKTCVVEDARRVFGQMPPNFVPGHPIAGIERNGWEHAFAELFNDRRVILTPVAETDPAAVERTRAMWTAAGARVETTTPGHHDQVLAETSHLPHVLAYALVASLAHAEDVDEVFRYAAGGFRDFTRIAAADPVMWRDICLANRDAVLASLERFRTDLDTLRAAIEAGDGEALYRIFHSAQSARDRFSFE